MKLILLGPPAAGKGTQAECIAERYSLAHISTGDMLRAEISKKTPLGLRAKALIDDGNLVPDEIINEMVLSRIQHEDCSIGFLLDGYPRTIAQAETLAGAVNISQCVSAADTAAGKPELCAKCGAELIRRPDDNPESMRHRLEVYYDRTFPLINFYREKGLLVPIDGAMSIGDVSNRIFAALDPIFEKNKKA